MSKLTDADLFGLGSEYKDLLFKRGYYSGKTDMSIAIQDDIDHIQKLVLKHFGAVLGYELLEKARRL